MDNTITDAERIELETLRGMKAKLEAQAIAKANHVTLKVSTKGALSFYGLGRFPVTLYRSQWEKLIANVESVKTFIEANSATLAVKPAKAE
jgi:hypothetical protein